MAYQLFVGDKKLKAKQSFQGVYEALIDFYIKDNKIKKKEVENVYYAAKEAQSQNSSREKGSDAPIILTERELSLSATKFREWFKSVYDKDLEQPYVCEV